MLQKPEMRLKELGPGLYAAISPPPLQYRGEIEVNLYWIALKTRAVLTPGMLKEKPKKTVTRRKREKKPFKPFHFLTPTEFYAAKKDTASSNDGTNTREDGSIHQQGSTQT